MTNAIDRLVEQFSKLPGVGKKSASRMAYHILDGPSGRARALADALASLHDLIRRCGICGGFTESDPCPVCADPGRDRALVCVVERAQDIRIIEETREYNGVFHALGGLIAPLEGVGPGDLSIDRLVSRLRSGAREVIIALNPTLEGDTTALYLQKILKDLPVEVSRLASGMPVGGDLEYTDRLTLSRSLRGRIRM